MPNFYTIETSDGLLSIPCDEWLEFAGFEHDNSCYNFDYECMDLLIFLWDIDEYLLKLQEVW